MRQGAMPGGTQVLRASEAPMMIHLAGGCFWGLERALEDLPGVTSTECGYANGDPHFEPDYMLVCSGRYGYREAVAVGYDPEALGLENLLEVFLFLIEPTQADGQGNDRGEQYRAGVYWSDPVSEGIVRGFMAEAAGRYDEFHVECGPLTHWTRAEEHHQRYLDRNPGGYCHISPWKMSMARTVLGGRRPARSM